MRELDIFRGLKMKTNKLNKVFLSERPGMLVKKITYSDGTSIAVKIRFGRGLELRNLIQRERIALTFLAGLAAPRISRYSRAKIIKEFKQRFVNYIAMSFIPGSGSDRRNFKPADALGLWLFTLEQLAAFRKRDILYTDIKPEHILTTSDLEQACLVDFDSCFMAEPKRIYPRSELFISPLSSPPETFFVDNLTESFAPYQLAMVLGALILGSFYNKNINEYQVQQNFKSMKEVKEYRNIL